MLSSETLGLWNFLTRRDFYFQTYFGYKILDIVLCNVLFSSCHINGNDSGPHLSLYHMLKLLFSLLLILNKETCKIIKCFMFSVLVVDNQQWMTCLT